MAFAGDDHVGGARRVVEAGQVEHDLDAAPQLRAKEHLGAITQPAGGAGAGHVGHVAAQLCLHQFGDMAQSVIQLRQRRIGAAFLAAIDPGRAVWSVKRIGDVAQHLHAVEGRRRRNDFRNCR